VTTLVHQRQSQLLHAIDRVFTSRHLHRLLSSLLAHHSTTQSHHLHLLLRHLEHLLLILLHGLSQLALVSANGSPHGKMLGHLALGNLLGLVLSHGAQSLGGKVAHELTQRHLAHALNITEVADVLAAALGNGLVSVLEELVKGVISTSLHEPLHGVIPVAGQAGIQGLAINNIIRRAVRLVGRVIVVSSGNSVNVEILGQVEEHGARVAGLHEEEEVLVHLVVVHVLDRLHQLLIADSGATHQNSTRTTVRGEVEHDVVIGSAVKNLGVLLASQLLKSIHISTHDSKHHLGAHVILLVVNVLDATVSIILARSAGAVISEELAREGVLLHIGHLLGAHQHNVLGLHTSSNEVLVHTAALGLHTVVVPVGSGSDDDGVSLSGGDGQKSDSKQNRVHSKRKVTGVTSSAVIPTNTALQNPFLLLVHRLQLLQRVGFVLAVSRIRLQQTDGTLCSALLLHRRLHSPP